MPRKFVILTAALFGCASLKAANDLAPTVDDASVTEAGSATRSDANGAPSAVHCSIRSPTSDMFVIDDLSQADAPSPRFLGQVWISELQEPQPNNNYNRFFVFSQVVVSSLLAYEVDVGASSATRRSLGAPFDGGLLVVTDVEHPFIDPTAQGPFAAPGVSALAVTGPDVNGGATAEQLIELPPSFGDGLIGISSLTPADASGPTGTGTFLEQLPAGDVWWMVSEGPGDISPDGSLPPAYVGHRNLQTVGDISSVATIGPSFFPIPGALVHLYGDVFGFGFNPYDGGAAMFAVADDLSEAVTQAPVVWSGAPCDSTGLQPQAVVVAAKTSAEDGARDLLWSLLECPDAGATVAFQTMSLQTWATLRSGPFLIEASSVAPSLAEGEVPVLGGAGAHALDQDDLFVIGSPSDQSGGLVHLWLGSDGGVVSRATTSGKLVASDSDAAGHAAVQFAARVGEASAILHIAWIESRSDHDVLWAAKVTCDSTLAGGE